MSNTEQKTYVGSAEIRLENTERRDRLVNAAKEAGFNVSYTEAIGISFSGANTPPYWAITVEANGKLDADEKRAARVKLASVWKCL